MGPQQQQQSNMSRMDEVIAAFKAVFDAVDTDGSGALDKAEILKVAKGIASAMGQAEEMANLPPEMADEMFKNATAEVDTDGDGQISFDELLAKVPAEKMTAGIDDISQEEFDQGKAMMAKIAECLKKGEYGELPAL